MSEFVPRQSPRLKLEAERLEGIARANLEAKQIEILKAAAAAEERLKSEVASAQGGPKATKKAVSKAPTSRGPGGSKSAAGDEGDEEEAAVQNVDLAEHRENLKGYPQPIVNLLVSDTPEDFKGKWPVGPDLTLGQWQAVQQIFVNSSVWVRKDQNVYLNEIRERALLFIVALTDDKIYTNFNEVGVFLKQLRDLWIGRMCDCRDTYILEHYTEKDDHMKQYLDQYDSNEDVLVRKGGRGANWDFELNDYVKLELKFSSTGKSGVDQLAQFVALNLEGLKALEIFGASYLDFFNGGGYLEHMVEMFNKMPGTRLIIPDRALWKKAAAATSPPASCTIKDFFQKMREINKDKKNKDFLEAKKTLVNNSFNVFINSQMGYLNGDGKKALQELLNNQIQKFFCIFTEVDGQVTCDVDQMPPFTIIRIDHEEGSHTFLIMTSAEDEHNIRVGLSWGNGGAGCNNPRAMFSLERKPGRGMGGGGFDEEGLEADDPEVQEKEYIFDDLNTVAILESKPPIVSKTEIRKGIVLRNGKVLMQKWRKNEKGQWVRELKGGRRKSPNTIYSKTKNVKSKKYKKSKFTKKYINKSRNKMSKNKKYRNKMSKNKK